MVRMCHFWAQNYPFAPNKKVLLKIINITFIYLLAPFIVKNLKCGPRVKMMCHFWTQSWSICKTIFFQRTVNKPCPYYSCVSTFQKSESDNNLLMK